MPDRSSNHASTAQTRSAARFRDHTMAIPDRDYSGTLHQRRAAEFLARFGTTPPPACTRLRTGFRMEEVANRINA